MGIKKAGIPRLFYSPMINLILVFLIMFVRKRETKPQMTKFMVTVTNGDAFRKYVKVMYMKGEWSK